MKRSLIPLLLVLAVPAWASHEVPSDKEGFCPPGCERTGMWNLIVGATGMCACPDSMMPVVAVAGTTATTPGWVPRTHQIPRGYGEGCPADCYPVVLTSNPPQYACECECSPGQHLGGRDKDDGHRECVPDKPVHKAKPAGKPAKNPVISPDANPPSKCPAPCQKCSPCVMQPEAPCTITECQPCEHYGRITELAPPCSPCHALMDCPPQITEERDPVWLQAFTACPTHGHWMLLGRVGMVPSWNASTATYETRQRVLDHAAEFREARSPQFGLIGGRLTSTGWMLGLEVNYTRSHDVRTRTFDHDRKEKAVTLAQADHGSPWGLGIVAGYVWK